MDKGTSIHEITTALAAFADAGIMTHAYLIYGFPGSTIQETLDALEIIRQCFALGILHSAFWHRYILTVHSPVFQAPHDYGISQVVEKDSSFARNDLSYTTDDGADLGWMGQGLKTAVYNFMNQAGLDLPIQHWFDRPVPLPTIPASYISV